MKHKIIREGDEFTCACGLRWGVGEGDPHQTEGLVIGVDMARTGGDRTVIRNMRKECNDRVAKIIKSLGE